MLIKDSFIFLEILRVPNQSVLCNQSYLFVDSKSGDHEFLHSSAWLIWFVNACACPYQDCLLENLQVESCHNFLSHYDFIIECLYLEENTIALRRLDIQFESFVFN
jgi:hypothetical protein